MQFKSGDTVTVLSGTERGYFFTARVIRARFNWVFIEELSGCTGKTWLVTPYDLENVD